MLNEINSVPEIKPPSKYSTTRAQPRHHKDASNIVGADFHNNNNIENIGRPSESSVHVDDFYYDYNFINFHEDLSDDFESDQKDTEDSNRSGATLEVNPTQSTKEEASIETANPPTVTSVISTVSEASARTWKTEEADPHSDPSEASRKAAAKDYDDLDDFLSEDYLLPVSTTRSPQMSVTLYSQTPRGQHGSLWWPENASTMPNLVFTTDEPRHNVKYGAEVENSYNGITEDKLADSLTVTHRHVHPTQTTINAVVTTTMSAQEMEEQDNNEYIYSDKSTLGPDISAEDTESPELEPETEDIPQITSLSIILPTAITGEDVDLDQTSFSTLHATSQYPWDAGLDLSTTVLPASEKSTPAPFPLLQISGKQEASDNSISTRRETVPPTDLEGATQPPPADLLPASGKHKSTEPSFPRRTGTESSSPAPSFDLADFDYPETATPTMMRNSHVQLPSNTAAHPLLSTTLHKELPSTNPPILRPPTEPPFVQSSTSQRVTAGAYWVTSNWSTVSLWLSQ